MRQPMVSETLIGALDEFDFPIFHMTAPWPRSQTGVFRALWL